MGQMDNSASTAGLRLAAPTRTRPRRWKSCPPTVASQLRGADLILHAGDVCTAAVLDELAQYAPVTAVVGNNDGPDVAAGGAAETAALTPLRRSGTIRRA